MKKRFLAPKIRTLRAQSADVTIFNDGAIEREMKRNFVLVQCAMHSSGSGA